MSTSNIVLVGFMGTGKSTVGKSLAARLGWTFLDSDTVIEQQSQTTVSELFRIHGEPYFRELESQALSDILSQSNQILATGGGAVLAGKNRACMQQNGFVVALKASPEVIIQRVSSDQSRPLLQGNLEERVHTLLEQRRHAYDFAHLAIDTSELDPDLIADLIMEKAGLKGADRS